MELAHSSRVSVLLASLLCLSALLASGCNALLTSGIGLVTPHIARDDDHDETVRHLSFDYSEEVTVESVPAGMVVFRDGREVGATPLTLRVDFGPMRGMQLGTRPAERYHLILGPYDPNQRSTQTTLASTETKPLGPTFWTGMTHFQSPTPVVLGVVAPGGARIEQQIQPREDDAQFIVSLRDAGVFDGDFTPERIVGRRTLHFEGAPPPEVPSQEHPTSAAADLPMTFGRSNIRAILRQR